MKKKYGFFLASLFVLFLTLLALKQKVKTRPEETFGATFSKEKFSESLKEPLPEWIKENLKRNFQNEIKITEEKLDSTFVSLTEKAQRKNSYSRYRILENELYKYELDPEKTLDTHFEKALKTLLVHSKLPDLDFIFCEMDGIVESNEEGFFSPILAQAKVQGPHMDWVILIPDVHSLEEKWYHSINELESITQKISWSDKKSKAFWRGGFNDTESPHAFLVSNERTPRMEIAYLSNDYPNEIDAGITYTSVGDLEKKCKQDDLFKSGASNQEHIQCKYLPVLDGHVCTYPGFQWRLFSKSLSLKQKSDQVQWFYSGLKEYEHYVPIKRDLSDLLAKIEWAKENDELAHKIAINAYKFAKENLSYEKGYRYLSLILHGYAEKQEIDFTALKNAIHSDPEWKCIQYRDRKSPLKRLF